MVQLDTASESESKSVTVHPDEAVTLAPELDPVAVAVEFEPVGPAATAAVDAETAAESDDAADESGDAGLPAPDGAPEGAPCASRTAEDVTTEVETALL